jgi:hypothetical protein
MAARKQASTTTLTGSDTAKKLASVILEVFAGVKSTAEAAEALSVSPNRYYQLEARGLKGMIDELEPRNRGRQRTPEREIETLKMDIARQAREISRLQALVRAARRTMGIPEKKKSAKKASARKRKPSHRGRKVIAILKKPKDDGAGERAAS